MKRFLALAAVLCLILSGCDGAGHGMVQPVTFYYVRAEYQYGGDGSAIGSELREAYGHRDDLPYLLALYLMGPSGEDMLAPNGIQILSIQQTEDSVTLNLTDTTLSDTEFSLACACLTLTCLDLTSAETVTVSSGARSVTMGAEDLILHDSSHTDSTEETT